MIPLDDSEKASAMLLRLLGNSAEIKAQRDELLSCLETALPYMEGLADKLKIATNSSEVAFLNVQIIKARSAIARAKDQ